MDTRPKPPRRPRGPAFPRLADFPWARIAAIVGAVALAAAALHQSIDIDAVHAQAARTPAGVAFALLLVLPLVGVPVSLLHVAAGIRFGAGVGFGLVVTSIALQLIASHAIVRRWRRRFEGVRWVARLRRRIPPGAHGAVCALAVLLPGAPYAAINYTLPLLGVPLRTMLACALPLHALRATVTVAFGDQSADLTGTRLAVLLAYALVILTAGGWLYHRLHARFSGPPPAAGDRRQPA